MNRLNEDQIRIHDLEVYCNHGVYPEETFLGQKFLVDVILYTNTRPAGLSDQLEDSVNYGAVCQFIEEEMKCQNDKLLEKVAERISRGILKEFPLIKAVDFEIKKPWAPVMRHIEYASIKIFRERHHAYIGLGSNMGNREEYLRNAIKAIDSIEDTSIIKEASFIETEPYGYTDQDPFMNTVVCVETLKEPLELLHILQKIELDAGRTREIHWGPRTLDLDILLFDQQILTTPELVVPHPEIEKRMFVLESLCEIAPYEVHPLLQKRFLTLKENLETN
ncbi:MAG: 2-amino-4-hydroxy-6-hydroxymethyldihydropteridine diphosphokinase [Eubacteriales bacterium]|nr:2-amino-4-hydroxy-6-hydroxymethyldihydropteridine diphosphokinase [Eubacteriales bacterium]